MVLENTKGEDMYHNRQLKPEFSYVIDITLRKDEDIRFERAFGDSKSYIHIYHIATNRCSYLIREGYRISEIRLKEFRFVPHSYLVFYDESVGVQNE
jgi:hypothetical protein